MERILVVTTNDNKGQHWSENTVAAGNTEDVMHVINVHPEVQYQEFHGFGGALTEASAHNYAGMSEKNKKKIIKDCFGEEGLRYNMARLSIQSCDFGLGNYAYIEEGDEALATFDISHDRAEIIPMVHDAQQTCSEEMEFLASPWSPPAFMKTNGEMNHGGQLKKEYYEAWAGCYVKFIEQYAKENIKINYLTVQNEPQAVQTWDSCVYSSEKESLLVRDYLGPKLEEAGLSNIGIYVWDHNKELAYQRFREVVADENTRKYVRGAALHWYTGDHFECTELIRKQYPGMEVFFTEGCVEYSRFADSGEVQKAEMYAHDINGNLNAGISASMDWNVLLDNEGGPNHVGNYCAAPLMCNPVEDTYERRLSFYYIGHYSRYMKRGAVRIGSTRYTDKLEVSAFLNPDGERVIVVLNRTDEDMPITLREEGCGITSVLHAHEIKTFIYKN